MIPAPQVQPEYRQKTRSGLSRSRLLELLLVLACLWVASCSTAPSRRPLEPGRTTFSSPLVTLPAQRIGSYLVLEAKWDRYGPYHFLIDTGSSVTLIAPALAKRYPSRDLPPADGPRVRVTSADGSVAELPETSLRRIELGAAHFDDVRALEYDCAPLSAHLGVKIDGVLGFPLFRDAVLTLDYPASRVILQPADKAPLVPGTIIAFDDARKTPLIHVRLGERSLVALIDSGSDATFSLNPVGVDPRFESGPVPGATVGTLGGDRIQKIGRLAETIAIGDQTFPRPIVETTDELSAIGGGLLQHFAVTFDQEHDRVTFYRDSHTPVEMVPWRSAGVSFSKTPAYWRVAGVIPKSPAAEAGVQTGDLVTRINGEAVARWDLSRYQELVTSAEEITFTFLNGNAESEKRVRVFDLVK